jgi:tetratricopeptide (TPR) repeat protein
LERGQIPARLKPHAVALIPGGIIVTLMLVWAVHNGGFDEDTWYWGALTVLALFTAVVIARGGATRISRAGMIALGAFALYVAWSYLSITWAQSPGDALTGSNRALLYLLVFATMLVLPWTVRGALLGLLVFAVGVGVVAVVLLFRLADAAHVADLIIGGRLAAPTGYFNSTAALFTMEALVAIALAARRELPAPLRGALIAFACAGLQLAVTVQSRGWLFTLPLVAIVAIIVIPDRLRVAATAVLPAAGAVVPIHRLLAVYQNSSGAGLNHAASRAGHAALLICLVEFFVATVLAWGDALVPPLAPSAARRRVLGTAAIAGAVAAAVVGGLAVSHGHPVRFVKREWNGFSHVQTGPSQSHFTDVGTQRYDFWRVALDAFVAHPIGGLGQDNFDDYYVPRRRTYSEPSYTHSIELRLLTHTGLVGFVLFVTFTVAAIVAVMPARRRRGLEAFVAATALLPLIVWLIHGSIDWFWEIPALSAPALGFLGVAAALGSSVCAGEAAALGSPAGSGEAGAQGSPAGSGEAAALGSSAGSGEAAALGSSAAAGNGDAPAATDATHTPRPTPRPAWVRALVAGAGVVALLAALYALVPAYLSVREVSIASDLRQSDPAKALHVLQTAADLNPLNADPGRIAGTIALQTGQYAVARERFQQSISREPGGWYAWLGAGLAASALGDRAAARHDLEMAESIDSKDAVISVALDRVDSDHPLSPADALQMLATPL